MVRIKLQRETHKRGQTANQFLFPVGKINQITIYPMTFDEYLLNRNGNLYNTIKNAYEQRIPLDHSIHELAMNEVYRYLLVGGMPEAIDTYLETDRLLEARNVLTALYDNYLSDMQLYQASQESILRSRLLFQNIYRELNRESKNFSPGLIQEKTRIRDFQTSIEWLSLAHIVNKSFQLKEHVTLPLLEEMDCNFRIYLSDMGMFSYQSGINASTFLATDRENTLSGIFFENFVAEELSAKNQKLFYWKGKASNELEFLVESNGELYPIDVKKGRRTRNSILAFSNHNHYRFAIKISKNGYGYDKSQRLMTIPFYFVPFLSDDLRKGTLSSEPDVSSPEIHP